MCPIASPQFNTCGHSGVAPKLTFCEPLSLAEGYPAEGDKALAIENYRRSLQLNPKNTNAVEFLRHWSPNDKGRRAGTATECPASALLPGKPLER